MSEDRTAVHVFGARSCRPDQACPCGPVYAGTAVGDVSVMVFRHRIPPDPGAPLDSVLAATLDFYEAGARSPDSLAMAMGCGTATARGRLVKLRELGRVHDESW